MATSSGNVNNVTFYFFGKVKEFTRMKEDLHLLIGSDA